VAFVARHRTGAIRARGYADLAPDFLAEILSLDDRPADVLAKVADWLGEHDSLDGEDVLPGFSCPLRAVLAV